jgi:hypothetical protein
MDWIKKNYDQFILALLALALLAASVMLVLKIQSFGEQFAGAQSMPVKSNEIPAVDQEVIKVAQRQVESPVTWKSETHSGLLFTSERVYPVNGVLKKPDEDELYAHSRTGEKMKNKWYLDFGLPVLDPSVPFQDPDGDGFLNENEWLHKTDPTKKDSHPPYHTELFLKQWIKVPFRLKFQAYDGNPQQPQAMDFQVNPLDAGARTQFVKIGDVIEGTKFKVIKFESKQKLNDSTGEQQDISELTVENTETSDSVALILAQIVSSPSQFGRLEYMWPAKKPGEQGQLFDVPRTKEFVLKPEVTIKYKLDAVSDTEAHITGPNGEKIVVKPYPPIKK